MVTMGGFEQFEQWCVVSVGVALALALALLGLCLVRQ